MKIKKDKNLAEKSVLPSDRESLYELVWVKPAKKIAQHYNVSTDHLVKKCRSLSLPRPISGYWKALEKGAAPIRPALLPQNSLPESSKEQTISDLPHFQKRIVGTSTGRPKRLQSNNVEQQNRLIKEARLYFPVGRISDTGYLKPKKRKLLDLVTSDTGLDKVLSFAKTLFTEFSKHGYSVAFDTSRQFSRREEIDAREVKINSEYHWNHHWKPYCSTLISIDDIHIGITIIKMSEKVATKYVKGRHVRDEKNITLMAALGKDQNNPRWMLTHDLPCGRLRLLAYSPYPSTEWSMDWSETNKQELSNRLPTILRSLKAAVPEIKKQIAKAESERKKQHEAWLVQQEKWRQAEIVRKNNDAIQKSKEELFSIMAQWIEDKRVQQFFQDAEDDALKLSDQEKQNVLERLSLARQFLSGSSAVERLINWKKPNERLSKHQEADI